MMSCLYNTQESLLTGLLTTMCQKQGRVTGSMGNLLSHVGTTSLRKLYPCVLLLYYSHKALHFWHFCSPNGWEFFPMASKSLQHQLGILQCHSTLTLSTWRQHQIPQVKGSVRPTKLPPSNADANLRPQVITCTPDPLPLKWGFPWPPLWIGYFAKLSHRTQGDT